MMDDLDRLARAMADPPAPDPAARAAALAAAMAGFDENLSAAPQGSAAGPRLKISPTPRSGRRFRRLAMLLTIPRLRPVLYGGVSLAAVAVALVVLPGRLDPPAPGGATSVAPKRDALATAAPLPDAETLAQSPREAPAAGSAQPQAGGPYAAATAQPRPEGRALALPGDDAARARPPAATLSYAPMPDAAMAPEPDRDRFEAPPRGAVTATATTPVSTFSVDVDTASYAFVRRALMGGALPPADAVRVEEMINYFDYAYPAPETAATPFRADVALMPTPWNAGMQLLRIGIAGYELPQAAKPRANLVFLIDTSGSMQDPDKLPLLVAAFRLLVGQLGPRDTVGIVAYAGSAGVVLEPTGDRAQILAALERLDAGGSTAGAEGIDAAYALAQRHFDPAGVNRVILATDGDFNVGVSDPDALERLIAQRRAGGVMLSVLGFGQGNLNDQVMQRLAQNGNGIAAHIDTLAEAHKVLVEDAASTLFPIASDLKIQVEFNPATIAEYRLIGYETRALAAQDFNNDRVDAGDIGSGHQVTALYELTPVGSPARAIDPLRYGAQPAPTGDELGFLKIRAKTPGAADSALWTTPITPAAAVDPGSAEARELRFAAAVAAFGQLLAGSDRLGGFGFDDVLALATPARGDDAYGHRAEFLRLVQLAGALTPR